MTRCWRRYRGGNRKIAVLCLSTGARWSEAARPKAENVIHNRVSFGKTKTNTPHTVPISDEVAAYIVGNTRGFLFPDASYKEFRNILKAVKPDLSSGQATHALRHYFAKHIMINKGTSSRWRGSWVIRELHKQCSMRTSRLSTCRMRFYSTR
ncbi:tyrosine-type recombinase/integrase [Erwinia sp. SLM-02]|uniref:tyrosine-type recombinase/integrase n=1 Tax=Erwinia sp. SLM-02 TaxID=3020057 RepID=UPI0030809BF8